MMKITAIIPTLNEEERIQNSLKSAAFADEIIVIDSYSTDRALELVKKSDYLFGNLGAFPQKNTIDHASYDWINGLMRTKS